MCAGEAGLLIGEVGFGSLFAPVVLASLKSVPHMNWLLVDQNLIFGWACFFGLVSLGLGILVHHISCGNQKHGFYGNNGTATYVPSEIQGRILSLCYVGAGFMFIGPLPMAMVAKALNGKIAIIGRAAMFLLISLELGLLRPYLRRLKFNGPEFDTFQYPSSTQH